MRLLCDTSFSKAKEIFQRFLIEQQLSEEIVWLFQEDVLLGKDSVIIKMPFPDENEGLIEKLYEIGRKRNLGICFHAFALLDSRPCCYIQLPVDEDEAERLLFSNSYLKCSVRNPLLKAKVSTGAIMWSIHKLSHKSFEEIPPKILSFSFPKTQPIESM